MTYVIRNRHSALGQPLKEPESFWFRLDSGFALHSVIVTISPARAKDIEGAKLLLRGKQEEYQWTFEGVSSGVSELSDQRLSAIGLRSAAHCVLW